MHHVGLVRMGSASFHWNCRKDTRGSGRGLVEGNRSKHERSISIINHTAVYSNMFLKQSHGELMMEHASIYGQAFPS